MTTPRKVIGSVVVLVGGLLALCLAGWCATGVAALWQPHQQSDLLVHPVYAYRQWQSTGIYLNPGDRVVVTAEGKWTYSPKVNLHGPAGGGWAPDYYPMPGAPGGALLGRVGETGQAFFVGPKSVFGARESGLLYLAINDDLLDDNVGELTVRISVTSPTPTPASSGKAGGG